MYSSVTLKNPWMNMQFRQLCVGMGYESQDAAHELWMICARDPLFFLNTFAYLLETRGKQDWDTLPLRCEQGDSVHHPRVPRQLIMDTL
jgi:hypothetical protein